MFTIFGFFPSRSGHTESLPLALLGSLTTAARDADTDESAATNEGLDIEPDDVTTEAVKPLLNEEMPALLPTAVGISPRSRGGGRQ